MKVILLQKVAGLGESEEVKEVSDGYAHNFLFPQHLAVQASERALEQIDAKKNRHNKEAERELRAEEQMVEQLDGLEIEILQKTNEQGNLYAALSASKISDALKEMDFEVDKKYIQVPSIKEVGTYKVSIRFPHGLEAEVTVQVHSTV